MNRTLEIAPWPDYAGNPIREGDTIRHPSDPRAGVVFVLANEADPNERWRVLYYSHETAGRAPRLVLQIGDKGQGVVVRSVSSPGHIVRSSSSRAEVFAQEERWRRRIEQAESFLSGALSPTGPWRGTSEAEEVQCSTAGGTMPPNQADCSIGEGSGSACPGLAVRTLGEIPPLFGRKP